MKVREIIEMIQRDGWYQVATKGSHRQYKHPTKPGRVTVAGKPSQDLAPGTLNSTSNRRNSSKGGSMHRFLVVIERVEDNYSAYLPDLPGCVAAGDTREEVEQNIHEAIQMHVQGMADDGESIPESSSFAEYIAV
jgi:predicted RNA binding protein YcfA (HicA-like mRNA interferase family)/predicted RNase H-like HicB family nuclease